MTLVGTRAGFMSVQLDEEFDTYETLLFVEERAGLGLFLWDLETDEVQWSDGMFALFGMKPGAKPSSALFLSMTHPDDRISSGWLRHEAKEGRLLDRDYRIVLRDGRVAFPDAEAQEYGPRRIVIATLSGVRLGALRVIAQDGFDYDGTHVLAPSTPCGKTYLLAWAPGEAPPRVPAVGCMAARLAHLRFASGQLRFELQCPEANVGFVGCATSEISVTGGPISLTAEGEQLFPEDSERLALRLPRSVQRWLRRHPRATLTLRWGQHSHRRVRVPRL